MTTITHAKDNFPTDIPAGPDQTPVQPKIKFTVTQKGINVKVFTQSGIDCLLNIQRSCILLCMLSFTTEPRKYWETFTKCGFRDWRHAMGKDGIISCHDHHKTHMQAMISWQEYM